jgi:hypothetical protein
MEAQMNVKKIKKAAVAVLLAAVWAAAAWQTFIIIGVLGMRYPKRVIAAQEIGSDIVGKYGPGWTVKHAIIASSYCAPSDCEAFMAFDRLQKRRLLNEEKYIDMIVKLILNEKTPMFNARFFIFKLNELTGTSFDPDGLCYWVPDAECDQCSSYKCMTRDDKEAKALFDTVREWSEKRRLKKDASR